MLILMHPDATSEQVAGAPSCDADAGDYLRRIGVSSHHGSKQSLLTACTDLRKQDPDGCPHESAERVGVAPADAVKALVGAERGSDELDGRRDFGRCSDYVQGLSDRRLACDSLYSDRLLRRHRCPHWPSGPGSRPFACVCRTVPLRRAHPRLGNQRNGFASRALSG
jgi:hypothetical protein